MQVQMDIARGENFISFPNNYPPVAIYHYDDQNCNYSCMSTAFIYWALMSLLNGQSKQLDSLSNIFCLPFDS